MYYFSELHDKIEEKYKEIDNEIKTNGESLTGYLNLQIEYDGVLSESANSIKSMTETQKLTDNINDAVLLEV